MESVELEKEVRDNPEALISLAEKAPEELREYMLQTLEEYNPEAYADFVKGQTKGIDWE